MAALMCPPIRPAPLGKALGWVLKIEGSSSRRGRKENEIIIVTNLELTHTGVILSAG